MQKIKSRIINIIGIILILLLIPIFIIVLTIAIKANIYHDTLPDFFGYKPLIVGSNSMSNVFEIGDLTIIKEIEEDELEVGDIISYWDTDDNVVITHRISEIMIDETGETIYVTKGDMNNEADSETVVFSQIEGKYMWHIKYIGTFILWLQEPQGLIVAFLIPLVICLLIYKHILGRYKTKLKRMQKILDKVVIKSEEHQE